MKGTGPNSVTNFDQTFICEWCVGVWLYTDLKADTEKTCDWTICSNSDNHSGLNSEHK